MRCEEVLECKEELGLAGYKSHWCTVPMMGTVHQCDLQEAVENPSEYADVNANLPPWGLYPFLDCPSGDSEWIISVFGSLG